MTYTQSHLYIYTITLIFLITHTAAQVNTTNTTSTPITTVPGTTQIYTSFTPTHDPTEHPTTIPTYYPTMTTDIPTYYPTSIPTYYPTKIPTSIPTYNPTEIPTYNPTNEPTYEPTFEPTNIPSYIPTSIPTYYPTKIPTSIPTYNPTEIPSQIPTINPTIEPTFITTDDHDSPDNTEDQVLVAVTITITIEYGNSTVTEKDIRDIIISLIYEELSDVTIQNLDAKINIDNPEEIEITWTMELLGNNNKHAELIEDIIKSDSFEKDLTDDIEAFNDNYKVTNINADASTIDDDDDEDNKTKVSWLDPMTYGILNWIIVGAAACILCILCLFICRCCYLCCSKTRRRAKSGYQVGKPMFSQMDTNTEADSAFQSDLRQAIEMNAQKKLLKNTDSVAQLDIDEVNAAFDMDFDEVKPINKTNKVQKVSSISDMKENDDANSDNDDDEKKELKPNKKGSEGIVKSSTKGDTLMQNITPGGIHITPGGDDDNPPPAPQPPQENVREIDEYDLL
eukprot:715349_1